MHAMKLLHTLFDNACQSIDKRLRKAVFLATESLTRCKQLSISGLGRSLNRTAAVKHNIKCIDRLFGNKILHKKRMLFYQVMTSSILKNNMHPVILIDWSGLTPCGAFYFLRASAAMEGRALTLYEQAYPLKVYTSNKTHKDFLKQLKNILPKECKPIIITDAGFRNPWFRAVLKMKWDFIGRIRHNTQYSNEKREKWLAIKSLYQQASTKACAIGFVLLSCSSPLPCYFYLMKQKKKYRVKHNLAGKRVQCSASKKHERAAKEPWLIASSLSEKEISPNKIMKLYKTRMQIEEAFRDLKNTRHGLGLRHCRSMQVERLNIALLIGALAIFILWLLGIVVKQKNLHYSFQANTEKRRNVLSCFVLGWQMLSRGSIGLSKKAIILALDRIIFSTVNWSNYF